MSSDLYLYLVLGQVFWCIANVIWMGVMLLHIYGMTRTKEEPDKDTTKRTVGLLFILCTALGLMIISNHMIQSAHFDQLMEQQKAQTQK